MPQAELSAGALLAGRYQIERELGRGGMGRVYRAHDQRLERPVAVKLLTDDSYSFATERFELEAKSVARLRSPYIVHLYDYGLEGALPFMVMELLEGESLAALLRRERALGLRRASLLLIQCARALATAHEAGIVHRDLKPANIQVLDQHGAEHVKVLDFGLAKVSSDGFAHRKKLTAQGVALGTPRYMAPEQFLPERTIDARADLWALGVIAYRMLAGRCPFRAREPVALIDEILHAPPPPLGGARALPRELDSFFERALAKSAANRFASAAELAQALAAVASDDGVLGAATMMRMWDRTDASLEVPQQGGEPTQVDRVTGGSTTVADPFAPTAPTAVSDDEATASTAARTVPAARPVALSVAEPGVRRRRSLVALVAVAGLAAAVLAAARGATERSVALPLHDGLAGAHARAAILEAARRRAHPPPLQPPAGAPAARRGPLDEELGDRPRSTPPASAPRPQASEAPAAPPEGQLFRTPW